MVNFQSAAEQTAACLNNMHVNYIYLLMQQSRRAGHKRGCLLFCKYGHESENIQVWIVTGQGYSSLLNNESAVSDDFATVMIARCMYL